MIDEGGKRALTYDVACIPQASNNWTMRRFAFVFGLLLVAYGTAARAEPQWLTLPPKPSLPTAAKSCVISRQGQTTLGPMLVIRCSSLARLSERARSGPGSHGCCFAIWQTLLDRVARIRLFGGECERQLTQHVDAHAPVSQIRSFQ